MADLSLELESGPKVLRFAGRQDAKVDGKGRVLLSRKIQEDLGKNFVLSITSVGSLGAFPVSWWEKYIRYLYLAPLSDERNEFIRRTFSDTENDNNLDDQGRLVIPSRFREQCGLSVGTDVTVNGALTNIEIWPAIEYKKWDDDSASYNRKRVDKMEGLLKVLQQDHPLGRNLPL
jgi:division/cell wall cluster transcriptional repressor MraZ